VRSEFAILSHSSQGNLTSQISSSRGGWLPGFAYPVGDGRLIEPVDHRLSLTFLAASGK
jgi:hypothetical protein